MSGTVGVLNQRASVHTSASDVLSRANFALMVMVVPRYKRLVMPSDFMWIKLSDDKAIPLQAGPLSIDAKLNQVVFTQKIGYRVIESPKINVDVLAGMRFWHMGTTLTTQPPVLGGRFYSSANWADALGGAIIQVPLSQRVQLSVLGDAGGGGAKLDYQAAGLLGWKFKRTTIQGGWRYLALNYRPNGPLAGVIDYKLNGLLLGVTIHLK